VLRILPSRSIPQWSVGRHVFVVSAVVTFTNIDLRVDFAARWLKAFITGWPVAAVLHFLRSRIFGAHN
jgi:hypothetical protein